MKNVLPLLTVLAITAASALATVDTQPTTTQTAATQPTTTAVTAATQPVVSPEIDDILTRLEKKRTELKTLQADIKYQLYEIIPDDKIVHTGLLRYRAETENTPVRFMIRFDKVIHDGIVNRQKEWYCFDGIRFREIREQTRHVIDRHIAKEGQRIDPFELGKGPFPLPFGQKKADMLKNFDITLKKPVEDDEPDTQHLVLTPKESSPLAKEYRQIEFWLDKKTVLPKRIATKHRDENITTVWFTDIKTNLAVKDSDLWIPKPSGFSYQEDFLTD